MVKSHYLNKKNDIGWRTLKNSDVSSLLCLWIFSSQKSINKNKFLLKENCNRCHTHQELIKFIAFIMISWLERRDVKKTNPRKYERWEWTERVSETAELMAIGLVKTHRFILRFFTNKRLPKKTNIYVSFESQYSTHHHVSGINLTNLLRMTGWVTISWLWGFKKRVVPFRAVPSSLPLLCCSMLIRQKCEE